MKKVLVIAVHPDDETLGCGGTLLRHKSSGDSIHWLIITSIDKTHKMYQKREQEIKQVSNAYQFDSIHRLDLPTMRVDCTPLSELVESISNVIKKVKPNVLYLPFCYDAHSDHRAVFQAAFSCTKSFRYPFITQVYMMETLSESDFAPALPHTSFVPNVFVDISDFINKKCEIMQIYESECGVPPFPRSVENLKALALYRGCTMGEIEVKSLATSKIPYGGGGVK